ncbi:uncharacterized protein L969DRAFT_46981 [Mixia osmundae IAM 14324]|uniref:Dienelactone hydrolase domain-containing protein n=1 Tax=Mixia osmundae (strain CBS 9802 / IAM 14324 / JCM 22182 / KY 12970) TaxID=764103 RepID=G7DZK1_MIXOS|nr:uncharacterized protein L969DRAFT_46981 [Mixia osmundae IAM 14324]KEI40946.1 hypothetical protein L969DRAFT_46981 [Mixia osmundae IAM 14324]GAA96011.1 hypothetical protein E5Q_02671 [Mixia osmundae IAM 14324]
MAEHPQCCLNTPAVKSDYQPQGKHGIEIAGFPCYVVGDEGAKHVLILAYDIFGYWPTTMLGCDMLASKLDARVIVPDLLRGHYWDLRQGEPTAETRSRMGHILTSHGEPHARAKDLVAFVKEIASSDAVESIGLYGLCLGHKIISLAATDPALVRDYKVRGIATAHPARLDPQESKAISCPFFFAPTKDEAKEECEAYFAEIKSNRSIAEKSIYKRYEAYHGFAGARAKLDDPTYRADFEDFYQRATDFFKSVF